MSILTEIKQRINSALKRGDDLEKNLFRVVLGDVQMKASSPGVDLNEELVYNVIRKHVAGLKETISLAKATRDTSKFEKELLLLTEMLPKTWDVQTIESFFLNHDDPLFESIRDANNEGQAVGIAMKALKKAGAPVDALNVKEVVVKVRNQ